MIPRPLEILRIPHFLTIRLSKILVHTSSLAPLPHTRGPGHTAWLTVNCFLAGEPAECSLAGVAPVPPPLRLRIFPAEVEVLVDPEAANFFSP